MWPSPKKYLLSTLGAVDPHDDRVIIFDVDKSEHLPLPSSVAFQISVSIRNAIVQQCIIDEGASTYVMAASVWKQVGSPDLSPSTITLCAWDGHPSQPLRLYRNYPIIVTSKTVAIDIEFIDVPLDYNIRLGRSYTYAMSAIASVIFVRCASLIMEISSLSINWHTMILSLKLHLSPLSHWWLAIRLSRPSPMSLIGSIKIPPCLVQIMVHHLLLLSIAHLVFACFKHHGLSTSVLVCLHNSQHLHNLLFPTQPNLSILLLKVHLLILISLSALFNP